MKAKIIAILQPIKMATSKFLHGADKFFFVLSYLRWNVFVVIVTFLFFWLSGQGTEIANRTFSSGWYVFFSIVGLIVFVAAIFLSSHRILRTLNEKDKENIKTNKNTVIFICTLSYFLVFIPFLFAFLNSKETTTNPLNALFIALFILAFLLSLITSHLYFKEYKLINQIKEYKPVIKFLIVLLFFIFALLDPITLGFKLGSISTLLCGLISMIFIGNYLYLAMLDKWKPDKFKCQTPFITIILFWAFILSASNLTDNHKIKLIDTKDSRISFTEYSKLWVKNIDMDNITDNTQYIVCEKDCDEVCKNNQSCRPLIIIATAGGGIRAAYWTGFLLSYLSDNITDFHKSIYGISGVSGGSVGAVVYNSSKFQYTKNEQDISKDNESFKQCSNKRDRPENCPKIEDNKCYKNEPFEINLQCIVTTTLSDDFLAPVFARMLTTDLWQRFIPTTPFTTMPDRAEALRDAWQISWEKAWEKNKGQSENNMKNKNYLQEFVQQLYAIIKSFFQTNKTVDLVGLNRPLSDLHKSSDSANSWQPALLLNSTHIETGKRVIASSVELDADFFIDAFDLTRSVQKDISLGDAALNSARFTYISPPGTLPICQPDETQEYFCPECKITGHLVDGGYFENFGATTASELLKAAKKYLNEKPITMESCNDQKQTISCNTSNNQKTAKPEVKSIIYRPIVILISNNPLINDSFKNTEKPPKSPKSENFANETYGPIETLLNTNDARGIIAAKKLMEEVGEENFFYFGINVNKDKDQAPALGWALSTQSEDLIEKQLCSKQNPDNYNNLEKLKTIFKNDENRTKCEDKDKTPTENEKA